MASHCKRRKLVILFAHALDAAHKNVSVPEAALYMRKPRGSRSAGASIAVDTAFDRLAPQTCPAKMMLRHAVQRACQNTGFSPRRAECENESGRFCADCCAAATAWNTFIQWVPTYETDAGAGSQRDKVIRDKRTMRWTVAAAIRRLALRKPKPCRTSRPRNATRCCHRGRFRVIRRVGPSLPTSPGVS